MRIVGEGSLEARFKQKPECVLQRERQVERGPQSVSASADLRDLENCKWESSA